MDRVILSYKVKIWIRLPMGLQIYNFNMAYHDHEYMTSRNEDSINVSTLDKLLLAIKGEVMRLQEEVEYWKKQYQTISDEKFKDGEIARMKKELGEAKLRMQRGFDITEDEWKTIHKWMEQFRDHDYGAIGGGFIYEFIPTSIGTIGTVKNIGGEQFTFREFD